MSQRASCPHPAANPDMHRGVLALAEVAPEARLQFLQLDVAGVIVVRKLVSSWWHQHDIMHVCADDLTLLVLLHRPASYQPRRAFYWGRIAS